mgnify:CR=1 FL=1
MNKILKSKTCIIVVFIIHPYLQCSACFISRRTCREVYLLLEGFFVEKGEITIKIEGDWQHWAGETLERWSDQALS